jgi:hypothetical protein
LQLLAGGDVNYDGSIFDDLDSAEDVGGDTNSYPLSCQETAIIRPGPLKLRGKVRRLFHHSQSDVDKHGATEYKEACSNLIVRHPLFWDVIQRMLVRVCLPTFQDSPLVSSSRV